jgi:hypothetical protein
VQALPLLALLSQSGRAVVLVLALMHLRQLRQRGTMTAQLLMLPMLLLLVVFQLLLLVPRRWRRCVPVLLRRLALLLLLLLLLLDCLIQLLLAHATSGDAEAGDDYWRGIDVVLSGDSDVKTRMRLRVALWCS